MDYSNFIDEIASKYGYDKNLKRAIEIILPLLIRKHGKEKEEDILTLFRDVHIFAPDDLSESNIIAIKEKMTEGVNQHIVKDEVNYNGDISDASYYFYPVYNENMEVIGEIRWIIAEKVDKFRKDGYIEIFDTDINVPQFLHEIEHAYGMKKPTCEKKDNLIFSKHGMFETVEQVELIDAGYTLKRISEKGRILEEMINEKNTIEMLVDYFCVNDYQELKTILDEIGHIPYIFEGVLVTITEKLETAIGSENLDSLRAENNEAVRETFNEACKKTMIANAYFKDEVAFDYLEAKATEIYNIKNNCQNIEISDYLKTNVELVLDALAVISAFNETQEVITLEEYEEIRNNALNKYKEAEPTTQTN